MTAEYVETDVPDSDAEYNILDAIGRGRPWVFLVAKSDGSVGLAIEATAGGGIDSGQLTRMMLKMAMDAIPESAPE